MADFQRPKLTREDFHNALNSLHLHIDKVFSRKENQNNAQLSWHENYGDVSEEVLEYLMAIQKNNDQECLSELHDIATAAIWGIASKIKGHIS
jgi:pantothenate kinase